MSDAKTLGATFLAELEAEAPATRKCLERVPETTFEWKPHDKSMKMGYLAVILADIPKWITTTINTGEIDFATFERWYPTTNIDLLNHFDKNMEEARKALSSVTDGALQETFYLKMNGKVLMSMT